MLQSHLLDLFIERTSTKFSLKPQSWYFISHNEQVLLQVGYFITSSPEPLPNWKYKFEVNNKKPNRYSSAGTKVQRCKQPKFQRPAPLAAIPMLAVVLSVLPHYLLLLLLLELIIWINKVSSPPIANNEIYWIGLMLSLPDRRAKFPQAKIKSNATIISFFLLSIVLAVFFMIFNSFIWKSVCHIKLKDSDNQIYGWNSLLPFVKKLKWHN